MALYRQRQRSQWASRDEIRARQLDRLRRLLAHTAAHVPYYQRVAGEGGVDLASIRDFDDFARRVPMMGKEELRRSLPDLHADDADEDLVIHRTGGSSGQPLEFPRDRRSVGAYWADRLLTRSWWGLRMGEPSALLWGHYQAPESRLRGLVAEGKEWVRRRATNTLFLSAYELSDDKMRRFARELRRARPTSIYGYASALETFARFLRAESIDLALAEPGVVISTSEPLFDAQRSLLLEVFRQGVANEYGSCEAGLIAFECPEGRMHLLEDTNLVEVVDGAGESLEEGTGEVVVTSLLGFSVPLIRYRIGDVARLSLEVCSCRRGGRVLEAIEGRTWSMLRGAGGEEIYPQVVTQVVMGLAPEARRFQAVQDRLDHVTVRLASSEPIPEERTRGIADELVRMMGSGIRIEVEVVDEIEPERSGKFVPVKGLVDRDG